MRNAVIVYASVRHYSARVGLQICKFARFLSVDPCEHSRYHWTSASSRFAAGCWYLSGLTSGLLAADTAVYLATTCSPDSHKRAPVLHVRLTL